VAQAQSLQTLRGELGALYLKLEN